PPLPRLLFLVGRGGTGFGLGGWARSGLTAARPLDLQLEDLPAVGGENLEGKAGNAVDALDHLARLRHVAGDVEDQAADRIHLVGELAGVEFLADHLAYLGQFGAGAGDVGVGVELADQRRIGRVVLVLDLADHGLQQVLDGDEAVGAAIFIDDDRHVDAARLHLLQQVADRHGGRHEQRFAHDVELADTGPEARAGYLDAAFVGRIVELGRLDDPAQRILDVDKAGDVVEILGVDRQARMASLEEARQQRTQGLARF